MKGEAVGSRRVGSKLCPSRAVTWHPKLGTSHRPQERRRMTKDGNGNWYIALGAQQGRDICVVVSESSGGQVWPR